MRSPQFKKLIITNLINIVHAPPYFEYQFIMKTLNYPVRYSVSTVLSNLIFLRVYLLGRIFTSMSEWTTVESEEMCEREGF
jgi:hypothetical protein